MANDDDLISAGQLTPGHGGHARGTAAQRWGRRKNVFHDTGERGSATSRALDGAPPRGALPLPPSLSLSRCMKTVAKDVYFVKLPIVELPPNTD